MHIPKMLQYRQYLNLREYIVVPQYFHIAYSEWVPNVCCKSPQIINQWTNKLIASEPKVFQLWCKEDHAPHYGHYVEDLGKVLISFPCRWNNCNINSLYNLYSIHFVVVHVVHHQITLTTLYCQATPTARDTALLTPWGNLCWMSWLHWMTQWLGSAPIVGPWGGDSTGGNRPLVLGDLRTAKLHLCW